MIGGVGVSGERIEIVVGNTQARRRMPTGIALEKRSLGDGGGYVACHCLLIFDEKQKQRRGAERSHDSIGKIPITGNLKTKDCATNPSR